MFADRIDAYRQIEKERESKLLVFATSNRDGMATQIASDILPFFTEHLDVISYVDKISLLLIIFFNRPFTCSTLITLVFIKDSFNIGLRNSNESIQMGSFCGNSVIGTSAFFLIFDVMKAILKQSS